MLLSFGIFVVVFSFCEFGFISIFGRLEDFTSSAFGGSSLLAEGDSSACSSIDSSTLELAKLFFLLLQQLALKPLILRHLYALASLRPAQHVVVGFWRPYKQGHIY